MTSHLRRLHPLLALPLLFTACQHHDPTPPPVAPACQILRVTPQDGAQAAFTNPLVTVAYTAATIGACEGVQLVDTQSQRIPGSVIASSEWPLPDGRIAGSRTIEPDAPLPRGGRVMVMLNGRTLSTFTTGAERRGDLQGPVEDLVVQYGGLPKAARIGRDSINGMLDVLIEDYAKGNPVVADLLRPLLRHELPHFAAPNASHDAVVKRVRYRSADASGAPITLSGLLIYPAQAPGGPAVDLNGLPMVIGQRGAEKNDADAPSSGKNAMLLIGLIAAGKGHIYFTPDLIGKGDSASSTQAFLIAADTAAQTDDMRAAVVSYFMQAHRAQPGTDLRIVGPSQGGFSAVAALPHLSRRATVRLVSTGDGPFAIRHTLDSALRAAAGLPRDAYSDRADLSRIPDYLGRTLAALQAYQGMSYDPKSVFQQDGSLLPSFLADYRDGRYAHWAPHLAVNSPAAGSQRYNMPLAEVRMYHFSKDTLIAARNTEDMITTLKGGEQRVASVDRGDCREDSALVKALLALSHSKSLPHTICLPFQLDDFIGRL